MNTVRSSRRVVQEVTGVTLAGRNQMTNGEGLLVVNSQLNRRMTNNPALPFSVVSVPIR